jgi:hypothetical protein
MSTQNSRPATPVSRPVSYEANRRLASQCRSEFLREGAVFVYQMIRAALRKRPVRSFRQA